MRALAKLLTQANQPELLMEIIKQGLADDEILDVESSVLLAAALNGAYPDVVAKHAIALKDPLKLKGKNVRKPAIVGLFALANITDAPVPIPPLLPTGIPMIESRLAYAISAVAQKKFDEAKAIAVSAGPMQERLEALAALTDYTDQGKALLETALALNAEIDVRKRAPLALLRLVKAGADAGDFAPATKLAEIIPDDAARELAFASIGLAKWKANAPSLGELQKPDEASKLRLGHAVRAIGWARANAPTMKQAEATGVYDGWKPGELRGHGYAGHALGLQDAK